MFKKSLVIVEGLIASGKSTLTRELGAALGENTLVLMEPDEKDNANPYLARYYEDPKRWAFVMQCHLLTARYRQNLHAQWHVMQGHGHAVLDRSLPGDTSFARLQHKMGLMTDDEFQSYQNLYHAMMANVLHPSICLRVLVHPETSLKRLKSRMQKETGRQCETAVSLEYLRDLDQEIDHMTGVLRQMGIPVLDIPWDDNRDTATVRKSAVDGLAARIQNLVAPDPFLEIHRRIA